jgi:putative restriction endonuclease
MKAVFDTRPTSIYDDDLTRHYQFPKRYLPIVEQCIGDWIVLRRPRADGGDLAYFATARIETVDIDLARSGMYFARLGEYLAFDSPVNWIEAGRYAEEALRNMPSSQVGVYLRGRSVRSLIEHDFSQIISSGLRDTLNPRNAERLEISPSVIVDAAVIANVALPDVYERRTERVLTNRTIREASFRLAVYKAYENKCAVTGLRVFDLRGNAEVHGAHIWSVADGGPDVVQNGIALSATVHWLFDRYLISVTDDFRLLFGKEKIPSELTSLLNNNGGKLHLPVSERDWPHPKYLKRHREKFMAANSMTGF